MAAPDKQTKHRKIGAYRVLGELGRGGMALVYRGLHEGLQREVAIKELLPEVLADREALSRFRREAFALAAFRHQNIVTLYDLVEKNDLPFMVMEYVDGPTLQGLIRDARAPSRARRRARCSPRCATASTCPCTGWRRTCRASCRRSCAASA